MAVPDPALRDAARRAFEAGRMRHALSVGWPALAIVAGAWPFATDLSWHLLAGIALIVSALGLAWRGRSGGQAVGPGLAAGVVPLVLPLLTMRALCTAESCTTSCLAACLAGGALAGAWFGARAGSARDRTEFLLSGALVAGLAGSLGCAFVGAAGIIGMVAAFTAVAAPLTLARPVRA